MQGKTKWFNPQKGFGFIAGEDNKDYFVHFTNIQGEGFKNLVPQENVEFEVEISEKNGKPQAVNVKSLN